MAEQQTPAANSQPKIPAGAGKEVGKSGTYLTLGFISAEEYNRSLVGKLGLQQYDIMRRSDPTVHAVLMVVKNPIIGATWDIEPASDDEADIEMADFVRRELFERSVMWPDVLREGLTCLDFGHCVFEKVLEACDFKGSPRIGLAKLASRKQRSIMKWAQNDGTPGITQIVPADMAPGNGSPLISIPRDKLVYIINEREGQNYEGISLLRFAYKPWKIKDSLEIMHAIALERMSLGIPLVKKGANNETVDETELVNARAALRQLRNNEEAYLEIPASLDVSFLDMKANSTKDVLPTIQYEDRQITLSVLAQFLELGSSGGSGSRATSADHSQLFIKSLDAVARTIQQPMQQEVVNYLVDLNYSKLPNGYPKLVFSNIDDADTSALATSVASLVTSGALTPDPDMENRLREVISLPALPDELYQNYPDKSKQPIPPGMPAPDGTPAPGGPAKTTPEPKKDELPAEDKTGKTVASQVIADARETQAKLLEIILADMGAEE